jgi:DNA-binding response OmpR family regulator
MSAAGPPDRTGSIWGMTASHPSTPDATTPVGSSRPGPKQISVLLYSDDIATRDEVRIAVGKRPSRDIEIQAWRECATSAAVHEAVRGASFDVLILDGEATPVGGLGLCRELKNEIFDCPPILVLTGRPQDGWLAAWSQADQVVPHPLDALAMSSAVAELGRSGAGSLVKP